MAARRSWLLRHLDITYKFLNQSIIFRKSAEEAHEQVIDLLRSLARIPLSVSFARFLRKVTFSKNAVEVGEVTLSQRLILAAGLLKGDGIASAVEALRAVEDRLRHIIPGWRFVPAIVGPVEYGSFTRHPRLRNSGEVVWRIVESRSTQNRVGLR